MEVAVWAFIALRDQGERGLRNLSYGKGKLTYSYAAEKNLFGEWSG